MQDDKAKVRLSAPAEYLVELGRDQLGHMSVRLRAEGLTRLLAQRSARYPHKRLAFGVAAMLAALGVAFVAWHRLESRHATALSFTVESGQMDHGDLVRGDSARDSKLRFSDGTEVVFFPGSQGHVRSVDEHGARIAVAGKARVAVVPWRGSHWLFDAGPFLITVKGTSFTAEWNDSEERLEIVLESGTVAVSGPVSDEAILLRAGQRLVISMREKEVIIRNIDAGTESRDDASVASAPSPQDIDHAKPDHAQSFTVEHALPTASAYGGRALTRPPLAKTGSRTNRWTAELAAGHFAAILDEAEQRGVTRSIEEASSDDLAALADAARYSRRDDMARSALTAQRRRFAGTVRANDAAFLLGRLEETAQHWDLALGWYERCLSEPRSGAYTSEALGRKMTVMQHLSGASRARPIAEEYLRRFENGTYAAAARALIRSP